MVLKDLIVIIGTIVLGCIILTMMVGDDSDSLKNVSQESIIRTVEMMGD